MPALSVVQAHVAHVPVAAAAKDTAPLSDSSLLARVQQGDEAAMATLYDSYSGLVFSVALRVLHDGAAAEDVLQEVFLRLWRRPSSFISSRGSLPSWLTVVTRNRAIDTLRRQRPMESVDELPLMASGNVFTQVETGVLMAHVRSRIADLCVGHQELLELAFFRGWTHLQIAERTRTPLGTVKTRIRTALLALRSAMQVVDHPQPESLSTTTLTYRRAAVQNT